MGEMCGKLFSLLSSSHTDSENEYGTFTKKALSNTANILTVVSTAFGSVTCATVIWLYILQP